MEFEFDEEKSKRNKSKHGIDFLEAQSLWADPGLCIIPARTTEEPRFLLITQLMDGALWSAIFTIRNENIRIISVRRARRNEEEIYQS